MESQTAGVLTNLGLEGCVWGWGSGGIADEDWSFPGLKGPTSGRKDGLSPPPNSVPVLGKQSDLATETFHRPG